MKSTFCKSLRLACLVLVVTFATAATQAQDVKLDLSNLDKLEVRASDTIHVSLDGKLLDLAKLFLKDKNPKEAAIKEVVGGLRGVYVSVFHFDKEGEYSVADFASVRTQLNSPGWSRMAGVKSKKDGENLEVYTRMSGNQINGIAVVASDPKQLAVVNIVGSIDLEKLVKLSGRFGIPSFDINIGNKE